jgi:predicted amidohydrolase YtcJ
MTARRATPLLAWLMVTAVGGCSPTGSSSPSPSAAPAEAATPAPSGTGTGGAPLVILGRIITMGATPVAEAILFEDGVVVSVGSRDEVLARAGDDAQIMDIGQYVAYPGFIDAHAHWIGDREYYNLETPADAMDAAMARGWTSISEQWVNPERLEELRELAAADALPLRVDAYLALNFADEFFGDWYLDEQRGPVGDHLRIQGLKIHLDSGGGTVINWEPSDAIESIGRANDAGWQVSVHTVSSEAHEMVLDAYEAALGPTGPNPLHHRIDHLIEVSDEHLARIVAMDLATVIHLDGTGGDWVLWSEYMGHGSAENLAGGTAWLTRWRELVEAGLHVAAGTDTPWFIPDFELTDDVSRPMDQIAGGMDGRGREFPTPDWILEQLLTAEQGLRAVTLDAAWALGDETRRGHLDPGTLADVAILSGVVLAATPDEIRAMTVMATIVGGTPVYCADTELCPGP